jgi:tetratricopeptide (TPR) repeat protein
LQNDTHVRVDVFYLNFSLKTQALINIIGSVVFILPISLLITYYGFDFAYLAATGWWLRHRGLYSSFKRFSVCRYCCFLSLSVRLLIHVSSACHFCCLLSFITTGFKSMAFLKASSASFEINPDNYKTYNNMGNAYTGLNEFEKAVEAYEKANKIEHKPQLPP